jgi:hypothetical protein
VALTRYEVVATFEPNFNFSQSFWFDRFRPGRISRVGKLCDPNGINVGSAFTTNYSLFQWDVVTVTGTKPNDTSRSLAYRGATLETCDVVALYIDVHMQLRSADLTALINCFNVDGYTLLARTSFSVTLLSGKYSPPLLGATPGTFGLYNTSTAHNPRAVVLNRMLVLSDVLHITILPLEFPYQDFAGKG